MARRTVSFGGVSPQRRDRGVPSGQSSTYQDSHTGEQPRSLSRKSSGRVSPLSLQPPMSRRTTSSSWRPSPTTSRASSQKRTSRPRISQADSHRSSKRDTVSSMSTFYFDSDADDSDKGGNAVRSKNKIDITPPKKSAARVQSEQYPGIHSRNNSSSKFSARETVRDVPATPKSANRNADRTSSQRPRMPSNPVVSSQSLARSIGSARTSEYRAGDHEIRRWSTQQVAAWLQRTGFEDRIISNFEDNEVDGATLLDMHVRDLKDVGIQSFGKRHQIWNELRGLRIEHGMDPVFGDDSELEATVDPALFSPMTDCASPLDSFHQTERQSDAYTNAWPQMRKIIPKPHRCYKGEQCKKFRKQQRLLEQVDRVHSFNANPTRKSGEVTELRLPENKTSRMSKQASTPTEATPVRTDSKTSQDAAQSANKLADLSTAPVAMPSPRATTNEGSTTPPGSPSLKARRFIESVSKVPAPTQPPKGILRTDPGKASHPPRASSLPNIIAKSKKSSSHHGIVSATVTNVSELPPSPFVEFDTSQPSPSKVAPSEEKQIAEPAKDGASATPQVVSFQPQDHLINAATSSSDSEAAQSSGRRFSRRSFNLRNARHLGQRRHFEAMPTVAETNSVYKSDEHNSNSAPAPPVPTGPGNIKSVNSPRSGSAPTSPKQAQSPTKKPHRASASQLTVPATPTLRHAHLPYPSLKLNTLAAISTKPAKHQESVSAGPPPGTATSAQSATPVSATPASAPPASAAPNSAMSGPPAAAVSAPSIALVSESPVSAVSATPTFTLPSTPAPHQTFPGFAREGWVRKRRNKLWRHEWNETYLRLQGSSLVVSSSASPNAGAVEIIDVGEYDVQPCPPNTAGKLASAMKSLRKNSRSSIGGLSTASSTASGGGDSAASDAAEEELFAWQLIPSGISQTASAQNTAAMASVSRAEDEPMPNPFRSYSVPDVAYHPAMAPTTPAPTPTAAVPSSPPMSRTSSNKTINAPGYATTPTTNASTAFTDRSSIVVSSSGRELKIHQFAVSTRDERIEWMREFMLAKALSLKKKASASGLSLPGAGLATPVDHSMHPIHKSMAAAGASEPDLANQLVSGSTTASNSAIPSASTSASVSLALSSNVSGDTSRKDSGSSEDTSTSTAPGMAISTDYYELQTTPDPTTPTNVTAKTNTSDQYPSYGRSVSVNGHLTPNIASGRKTSTISSGSTNKGYPQVLTSGNGSFVLSSSSSSSLITPKPSATSASTTAAAAAAAAAAMRGSAAVASRAA